MSKLENWQATTVKNKSQKTYAEPISDAYVDLLKSEDAILDKIVHDLDVQLKCVQPDLSSWRGMLIAQAVYYVANNDNKTARKILLDLGMTSYQAKTWVKAEQGVQRRNPEEKSKYFNKPMPKEFKLGDLI